MKVFDLQQDWALARNDNGWRVIKLEEDGCYDCGSSYSELSRGKTVVEAIRNAHREVEESRQREEARRADYEKRKAEGSLYFSERAAAFIPDVWTVEILNALKRREP